MADKTELDRLIEDVLYVGKLRRQIEWDRMKDIDISIHEKTLAQTEERIKSVTQELNKRMFSGYYIPLEKELVDTIFMEGPELARFSIEAYLQCEVPIWLSKLYKMPGYDYCDCGHLRVEHEDDSSCAHRECKCQRYV